MDKKRRLLILSKNKYGEFDIKGQSFRYNQLVTNGNFVSVSSWQYSNCSYVVENNVATITPSAIHSYFRQTINGTNGHKYYYCFDIKYANNETYLLNVLNVQTSNTGTGQWEHKEGIISVSNTNDFFNIYDYDNNLRNEWQLKNVMLIDLTVLGLDAVATIDDFYNTDIGKAIQSGFYIPYSQNCAIYNAETPLKFNYGTFTPRTNFQLRGIENAQDLYNTKSGIITRKIGVVDLGTLTWNDEGDNFYASVPNAKGLFEINGHTQICAIYKNATDLDENMTCRFGYVSKNINIHDNRLIGKTSQEIDEILSGQLLYYELENTTTEQVENVALNVDTNKCYDKNRLELEIV